jgi:hypothetical protein
MNMTPCYPPITRCQDEKSSLHHLSVINPKHLHHRQTTYDKKPDGKILKFAILLRYCRSWVNLVQTGPLPEIELS